MHSPDTRNISLLGGILRIDRHVAGVKTGYQDVGEADKFDLLTPDLSEIELFTSRTKDRGKVKGSITKYVPKIEISGYELDTFQLALQTLGVADFLVQGSGNEAAFELTDDAVLGRSYFLGHRNVSNVVITGQTTPEDYVVDAARGMIYIPPTSGIAAGSTVNVAYNYTNVNLRRVRGGAEKQIHCSMFYTGDSAEGLIYDANVFHCLVRPSANFALINPGEATEYSKWTITADVLSDAVGLFGGNADNPFFELVQVGVVS